VLELVRAAGAEVVSSADLVTRFYAVGARRSSPRTSGRRRRSPGSRARPGSRRRRRPAPAATREHALQQWILERFAESGSERPPADRRRGEPTRDPHSSHPERRGAIASGSVLADRLWAREPGAPYADQTWMGVLGTPEPACRRGVDGGARTRARRRSRSSASGSAPGAGARWRGGRRRARGDRGARPRRPLHAPHRPLDRPQSLHGAGPHIDNLETREDRLLLPGVGFSIEPGVYVTGEIGMRSEVNAYVADGALVVTPRDPQRDLIVV
jgi:hypothetical protein